MRNDKSILDGSEKYFSFTEMVKRNELLQLMHDWKKEISKCEPIQYYDNNKFYKTTDYFGIDGFLPGYYKKKPKVLFIGRESRANSKSDSVINIINHFRNDKDINTSSFWRRILYIVYGIKMKGKVVFNEIPNTYEIAKEMARKNDFGFALINISKYSNDRLDGGKADLKLINRFLEDSKLEKRNFFLEEVKLLDPDIIITANLWDGKIKSKYLDICFPKMKLVSSISNIANYWLLKNGKKTIILFDLWHFSRPGSDKEKYYDPVMKFLYEKDF